MLVRLCLLARSALLLRRLLTTLVGLLIPLLLGVLLLLLLLRRPLLRQQRLDRSLVGSGVVHAGMCLQRLVIGRQRILVATQLRQRIAPVVTGFRALCLAEIGQRGGVIAPFVVCRTTSHRVVGQRRCALEVAFTERFRSLLFRRLPQVLPGLCGGSGGSDRRRRRRDADGQQRHAEQPATAEHQHGQRQQQQHQPGAPLKPTRCRRAIARLLDAAAGGSGSQQRAHILVVVRDGDVRAAAGHGNSTQRLLFKRRNNHLAASVVQRTPTVIAQRRPCQGTDTEHCNPVTGLFQSSCRRCSALSFHAVGDQQHLAFRQAGLLQQFAGLTQAEVGTTALERHDARFERMQLRTQRLRIPGKRRDGERITGEHDQADLALRGETHNIFHLVARACQAVG